MICISSIDAHSDAHSKHTMCFYCTSIVEGGPSLKQHLMFAGRRVSYRHYICLYSSMCEEQRTLITVIKGQWRAT